MFISQTVCHPLDQLDLVVESFGHTMAGAVPKVTDNRFEPTGQRPSYPLSRLLGALAGSFNQLEKRLSSGFFICAVKPRSQSLYPVNHVAQLWKAPTPLVTGHPLVHVELIGRLQPAFAQFLQGLGFLWIELFLHQTSHLVKRIHRLFDEMETIENLHLIAKDLFAGCTVCLGHIPHHDFHPVAFGLWTALAPGDDLISTSALQGGHGLSVVQVDHDRVVTMPLAPGIFINTTDAAELAGASTTTPCKGPAKHGAFGETIAAGEVMAWATSKACLADLVGEALGPLHTLAKGLTLLPGSMMAIWAPKAPQMSPQHDRRLQDRQVAEAPRPALLEPRAAPLTEGTHDGGVAAFEVQIQRLWANDLIDDTEFWPTE